MATAFVGAGCTAATNDDTSTPPSDNNQVSDKSDNTEIAQEPKREKILDVVFQDYDGNDVSLADFAGKPVIANSWAVWCPFCVKELPDFAAVQKELGDEVIFVAINRKESKSRTEGYLDERGVMEADEIRKKIKNNFGV